MAENQGQLILEFDRKKNLGALAGLIEYLKSRTKSLYREDANEERKGTLMQLGFAKMAEPIPNRLKLANFDINESVGFGRHSKIWKANGKAIGWTGQYAIKQQEAKLSNIMKIWKERDALIRLKSERICQIIGAFYEVDIFFVLELCHGNVSQLCGRINPPNVIRFTYHLIEALCELKKKNIIHANITPENCLINSRNNLVLSDFGKCIFTQQNQNLYYVEKLQDNLGYLDLYALQHLEFSAATDIFAAACVIFKMDTQEDLLFIPGVDQDPSFYIDVLQHGHQVQGLNETETLSKRVKRSSFSTLLTEMIKDDGRITCFAALEHKTLSASVAKLKKDGFSINGADQIVVTREYAVNAKKKFQRPAEVSPKEVDPSLFFVYYDENQI